MKKSNTGSEFNDDGVEGRSEEDGSEEASRQDLTDSTLKRKNIVLINL
jgi:hypothetical protein